MIEVVYICDNCGATVRKPANIGCHFSGVTPEAVSIHDYLPKTFADSWGKVCNKCSPAYLAKQKADSELRLIVYRNECRAKASEIINDQVRLAEVIEQYGRGSSGEVGAQWIAEAMRNKQSAQAAKEQPE